MAGTSGRIRIAEVQPSDVPTGVRVVIRNHEESTVFNLLTEISVKLRLMLPVVACRDKNSSI